MPGFKDFINLTALLETDLDDLLMKQSVIKFTSAAQRTAQLTGFFREGLVSYLDDLNTIGINTGATDVWSTIGPVHGALSSWTPTITQLGGVTFTNDASHYMRIGRFVFHWFHLTVTGAGTGANAVILGGLPFTMVGSGNGFYVGLGEIFDTSASLKYQAGIYLSATTSVDFRSTASPVDNRLGINTFTAALAVGDVLGGYFITEAAADA